ncbi:MAG TPA: hypothetical protein VGQ12_07620 [Candidatus Angelobacter sp.]|jgi:hypothetical protein|nr:hypothetical protein [Candidatus Angelobacter sp.]
MSEETSLPMPGGPLPSTDRVIPYQGGAVRLSPAAQQTSKAAEEFAKANPMLDALISAKTAEQRKSANRLDDKSQNSLNDLRARMRSTPAKAATVINLHPWDLMFPSGIRLLRGIQIPACHPGMPFAYHHIRGYRMDWEYNEDGTQKFMEILPITLAAQFVREFSDQHNDGGGVIVYEGDGHPDKMGEVEVYDPIGRVQTREVPGVVFNAEDQEEAAMIAVPIKRKLSELIEEARQVRNRIYLDKYRRAYRDYNLPGGKGKFLVTPKHMLISEVLLSEGLIAKLPDWNPGDRSDEGLEQDNCKACGTPRRKGAYKCLSCNSILNALEAFKDYAIEWGHAKFDALTSDEYAEAEAIYEEREKQKAERGKAKKPAGGKTETKK